MRNDCSDTSGTAALHGVYHDEQFHQIVVGLWRTDRLNNVHIISANGAENLDLGLTVGKSAHLCSCYFTAKIRSDALGPVPKSKQRAKKQIQQSRKKKKKRQTKLERKPRKSKSRQQIPLDDTRKNGQ
jgi:hypothetical protein